MALTSEQMIKHIAGTFNTTVETLCFTYYANEDFQKEVDKWLNPINKTREKNGLEAVVFPKNYYEDTLKNIKKYSKDFFKDI
jgi:hypothetical protein